MIKEIVEKFDNKQYDCVIEIANRILTKKFNKKVMLLKAKSLYNLGKIQNAKETYLEVINNDYDDFLSNYEVGNILFDECKYDEAKIYYLKCVKYNDVDAINNLGLCYLHTGDYDTAIIWYKKALKINPNDVDVLNNIGLVYGYKKEFEKSLLYFQKALAINKNDEDIVEKITYTLNMINRENILK